MNFKWITDPRSKEPSVPLTLLIITFVVVMAVNILDALHKLNYAPGSLENILWGMSALYFSHHNISIGGKSYSSKTEKENQ